MDGSAKGKWIAATDVQRKYVSFEFESAPGQLLLEVFVNEEENAIKVRFPERSSAFEAKAEDFLDGLDRALRVLREDLQKGFSGSEP